MSSVPPVEPVVPVTPAPQPDNNFAQLRAHANQVEADLKKEREARAASDLKLQEIERSKLEESERLKLEVQDWQKKATEGEQFKVKAEQAETRAQARLDAEIALLPADMQEKANKLIGYAPTAMDKLEAFAEIRGLLTPATPAPLRAGSGTNVSLPGSVPIQHAPPVESDPKEWDNLGAGGFINAVKEAAMTPGVQKQIVVTPEQKAAGQ